MERYGLPLPTAKNDRVKKDARPGGRAVCRARSVALPAPLCGVMSFWRAFF